MQCHVEEDFNLVATRTRRSSGELDSRSVTKWPRPVRSLASVYARIKIEVEVVAEVSDLLVNLNQNFVSYVQEACRRSKMQAYEAMRMVREPITVI